MSQKELRYPIGQAQLPNRINREHIEHWIHTLEQLPAQLEQLVAPLDDEQLDTPYREGGWTIRQVLHHLVDSHTNSYIRFKWALTEEEPVIKAYFEERWAELEDSKAGPIDLALNSLKALHAKWTYLLRTLDEKQLKRCFVHPEGNKKVSLAENIGIYAWHSEHHYAHIARLLERKGWT